MKTDTRAGLRNAIRTTPRLLILAISLLVTGNTAKGQDFWSWQMLKCPLATTSRRQVVRRLGKLSRNLQDLASDKQDLAEAVSNSNNVDIQARLEEIEQTVKRLRRNLDTITSILHPADRQRGGVIAERLFSRLTQRNSFLDAAKMKLKGSQPDANSIRNDLENGVRLDFEIQQEVDALITELQNKPCPP